jgi:hypothetical protein
MVNQTFPKNYALMSLIEEEMEGENKKEEKKETAVGMHEESKLSPMEKSN